MKAKTRSLVLVTDFGSPELDTETAILEPLGCEVTRAPSKTEDGLIAAVKDADYIITQFAPVTAKVIAAMTKCRIIVRYGIGVDNVDLKAAAAKGIPVCNVPDYCVDEVADHTLAMILDLTRRITPHTTLLKSGKWALAGTLEMIHALKDMTIGLVAFGRIGREVAARLKPFKPQILVFDPVVKAETIRAEGYTPVTLDQLLKQSDLITLHCPSNEKTKHMINAQSIAQMKPGVFFVNTSRGTLAKSEDLIAALQKGIIAGAALDVFDPEPIPADNPLMKMDNVLITPHMASCSPQAVQNLRVSVANTVAMAVRGERLSNVVNGVKK
jgi:D-3-phosphoglycerate dehydrogenase / 2-oxoglutarate reductase